MRTLVVVLFLAVYVAAAYGSEDEEQKINKRFLGPLKDFIDKTKKKLEDVVKDLLSEAKKIVKAVTKEAKEIFEKNIKNLPFDDVLDKLVGLIDSTISQEGCHKAAEEAIGLVAEQVTGSRAIAQHAAPVVGKLCNAALHILQLEADKVKDKIN